MAAGPGSVVQTTHNPDPLLWNVTDNEVVQVYNPLSEDFIGLVGQSKPVNVPFQVRKTVGAEAPTADETSVQNAYGITLKNPDHRSAANITTTVVLPAGKTTSLLGGVAKVVVGQLVTEMMQRADNSLKMADPSARLEVEQQVVRSTRGVQEFLPNEQSQQERINQALDNVNRGEDNGEAAFPTAGSGPAEEASGSTAVPAGDTQKRGPGRPAKTS